MSASSGPSISREPVEFAQVAQFFTRQANPKQVKTAALRPVAIWATVWALDLCSNFLNIVKGAWFGGSFGFPPVVSGLVCALAAHYQFYAFFQVVCLAVVQGLGLLPVVVMLPKTEWPLWLLKSGRGLPTAANPLKSSETGWGVLIGVLVAGFAMMLSSALNGGSVFVQGVAAGTLGITVIFEHFVLVATLATLAAAPYLARRARSFDGTIPIRITGSNLANGPTVLRLNETTWATGSVNAELDPAVRHDVLALARPSGTNEAFYRRAESELDLTAWEWIFINVAAVRKRFQDAPRATFNQGEEEFFTAETVLSFKFQSLPAQTAIAPDSVDLIVKLFDASSTPDRIFEELRNTVISEYIQEGLPSTLAGFREQFARLQASVEQAGFSQDSTIGALHKVSDTVLQSMRAKLSALDSALKKWKGFWEPVRNKRRDARALLPEKFAVKIKDLLQHQASHGDLLNLGSCFEIGMQVTRFEFQTPLPRDMDQKPATFTEDVARRSAEAQSEHEKRLVAAEGALREAALQAAMQGGQPGMHALNILTQQPLGNSTNTGALAEGTAYTLPNSGDSSAQLPPAPDDDL